MKKSKIAAMLVKKSSSICNLEQAYETLEILEELGVIDPPSYKLTCGCCYETGWEPEDD